MIFGAYRGKIIRGKIIREKTDNIPTFPVYLFD